MGAASRLGISSSSSTYDVSGLEYLGKNKKPQLSEFLISSNSQCSRDLLVDLLKTCGDDHDLARGKRIHDLIASNETLRSDRSLANLLLQMYSKCGSLEDAQRVFDGILDPDSCSWTTMVSAYSQRGDIHKARDIFEKFPASEKTIVSWNALLAAYVKNGFYKQAKQVFDCMPGRNIVSWTTIIHADALSGDVHNAKKIFSLMPEKNLVSWNTMLQAFIDSGQIDEATSLFKRMPQWNVVSWNSILAAATQSGRLEDAERIFISMRVKSRVRV